MKTIDSKTKVALITGANRGVGLEIAKVLAAQGIHVIVGARERAKGERAAAQLASAGHSAEALQLDVTSPADRGAAREHIERRFGRLDILVNNAGILDRGGTCESPLEELRRVFETNFFAVVGLTQELLPLIRRSAAGRIVNITSILGSLTMHSDPSSRIYSSKLFSYGASKTALNAFTVHLAYELRDTPIKVNSADPGWVKSDMGGPNAPMELSEGGRLTAPFATLPADGPSGGFFRLDEKFPW